MGVIESIEYYTQCPSCGAANAGHDKCEYCGASLIKKRVNESVSYGGASEAEENYYEDMDLPEIKGALRGKDSFLILFCVIFGGCFTLVPIIIGVAFISTGIMEAWVVLMLAIFLLIGIGSFVPLIRSIIHGIKCKNGEDVSGVVRCYEDSMSSVNGKPVLNARVKIYEDGTPKILVLGTGSTQKLFRIGAQIYLKRYKNSYIIDKERTNVN